MSETIKFKPFVPPAFDASFIAYAKGRERQYQLQIGSRFPPIVIKRSPPSLKLLARNVLLKHRPHKDWVEFCSYSKEFRDALINPLMIKVITPQLLEEAHPA